MSDGCIINFVIGVSVVGYIYFHEKDAPRGKSLNARKGQQQRFAAVPRRDSFEKFQKEVPSCRAINR